MKRSKKYTIPLLGGLIWVLITGCLGTSTPISSTEVPTESVKQAEVQSTNEPTIDEKINGPVRITGTMKYTNEFVTGNLLCRACSYAHGYDRFCTAG